MADESKYPTRIAPYGLRMAPDLKARIQDAADQADRSLHGELIHALEREYPAPPRDVEEHFANWFSRLSHEHKRMLLEADELHIEIKGIEFGAGDVRLDITIPDKSETPTTPWGIKVLKSPTPDDE